ncbi:MAG: hypothetical protein WAO74_09770, partial [Polaribacter sp.]
MAVKGSGALSIATDIVGEFGGDAPHSLSEYYGGGTYVPAGANPGIATSGAINFGSHYGAVAATVLTISSNVNNYDIGAQAISAGGDKSTPVILTINAGVTVGSTSASTAAMFTGTGWASGTTINITNNGSIVGLSGTNTSGGIGTGGNGGNGTGSTGGPGVAGGTGSGSADSANTGGDAFEHSQTSDNNLSVIFDTVGTRTAGSAGTKTISGGGGGGGAGGGGWYGGKGIGGPGGGGGAGSPPGAGGARGVLHVDVATAGTAGTTTSGGAGGPSYAHWSSVSGAAGDGGDPGLAGGS